MRPMAYGALLGLTTCAGILLVLAWMGARRVARVAVRIRPHVGGPTMPNETSAPWAAAMSLVLPRRTPSLASGLRARLARAGSHDSPGEYRLEQVALSALGACVGGACAIVIDASAPLRVVILSAVGALAGAMSREWRLTRQARQRRRRLEEQLPAAAELLAFALAAGESPHGALVRVARTMNGELASEFAMVVGDMRSGTAVESALRAMAGRTASEMIGRFADGMLLAIERGTPLADVMRAQAADARSDSRRRLLELAGRKDVAMLVPVVFLILPTVVVVALFPGLHGLRLVAP